MKPAFYSLLSATLMLASVSMPSPAVARPAVTRVVECASVNGGYNYCAIPDLRSAKLIAQLSRAPCAQGFGWKHDTNGIIVDHGCAGRFVTVAGGDADAGGPPYDGCHGEGCLVDRPDRPAPAPAPSQDRASLAQDGVERCAAAAIEKGWSIARNPRVNRIIDTYPDDDGYHVEGELIFSDSGRSTAHFLCVWDGKRPTVLFGS